jgi:hypothetical protein
MVPLNESGAISIRISGNLLSHSLKRAFLEVKNFFCFYISIIFVRLTTRRLKKNIRNKGDRKRFRTGKSNPWLMIFARSKKGELTIIF